MRRLPQFLLVLSGLFFAAALTSYVSNPTLTCAMAASGLAAVILFVLGLGLNDLRVRRRIPALWTFTMRLRPLHDEGIALDSEVIPIINAASAPPDDLLRRLRDWDQRLWKAIGAELPEQGPMYQRDVRPLPESQSEGWGHNAHQAIGDRLSRVAGLLHEARRVD